MKNNFYFTFLLIVLFAIQNTYAAIGWVGNRNPSTASTPAGEDVNFSTEVWKDGVTNLPGQGAGISCQIYYGSVSVFGGSWTNINTKAMVYLSDIGNNDFYIGTLGATLTEGLYEFKCRCTDDGGTTWEWDQQPNGQLTVTAPLPVTLSQFGAVALDNEDIKIFWTTESEINNSHFDIEKSSDAKNWSLLGSLPGRGTTAVQNQYSFPDKNPVAGNNYYRLKQVDFDGRFEYSNIVLAKITPNTADIYPNPVSQELFIPSDNAAEGDVIEVYSLQGTLVKSTSTFNNTFTTIDCTALSSGVYLLHIRDAYGAVKSSQRFVKH
jgi:Secretion system C-terminal sorting domain